MAVEARGTEPGLVVHRLAHRLGLPDQRGVAFAALVPERLAALLR